MPDNELEEWCDKTFNLMLIAFVLLDKKSLCLEVDKLKTLVEEANNEKE